MSAPRYVVRPFCGSWVVVDTATDTVAVTAHTYGRAVAVATAWNLA